MQTLVFFTEFFEERKLGQILWSPAGAFAGDDVEKIGDGKFILHHPSRPGSGKALDAIRCKDQIEIEGAAFDLHKIFAALNFGALGGVDRKPEAFKRVHDASAVRRAAIREKVEILSDAWKAKEDGSTASDEQVIHLMLGKDASDLDGLERMELPITIHSPSIL